MTTDAELKPFTPVRTPDDREGRIHSVYSEPGYVPRYRVAYNDDESNAFWFVAEELTPFVPDDLEAWSRERFPLDLPPGYDRVARQIVDAPHEEIVKTSWPDPYGRKSHGAADATSEIVEWHEPDGRGFMAELRRRLDKPWRS